MAQKYTVMKGSNGKYLTVMIISEHDIEEEATAAKLSVTNQKSKKQIQLEIEKLLNKGINAEEDIKDMTPEEMEVFLKKLQRRFTSPMLDVNIED